MVVICKTRDKQVREMNKNLDLRARFHYSIFKVYIMMSTLITITTIYDHHPNGPEECLSGTKTHFLRELQGSHLSADRYTLQISPESPQAQISHADSTNPIETSTFSLIMNSATSIKIYSQLITATGVNHRHSFST